MRLAAAIAVLALGVAAANADDVLFSGDVVTVCSVLAKTNGTLRLNTSGDAMTSEVLSGGTPGSITLLSIGNNRISVSAPVRTGQGAGYVASGEAIEVSYLGASGLSLVNQAFTPSASFVDATGAISASVLTVNNRIVNTNGFTAGTYSTKTTITCAPTP